MISREIEKNIAEIIKVSIVECRALAWQGNIKDIAILTDFVEDFPLFFMDDSEAFQIKMARHITSSIL